MPNLTTALPRRTGDLQTDYNNLYNAFVSLVDELKSLLCNLDAGNVTEAASVKVQNLDATQAKIKDAQISSLTADKLTAGTIDVSDGITIQGKNDDKVLSMSSTAIVFRQNNEIRIAIGYIDDATATFIMQNAEKTESLEMDSNGNIVLTGRFQTGKSNENRIVIDGNGIQSYAVDGGESHKSGLWCKPDISTTDFAIYRYDSAINKEIKVFEIFDNIDGLTMRTHATDTNPGHQILSTLDDVTTGRGTWKFEHGATNRFNTLDGKTVTVIGGLITSIE